MVMVMMSLSCHSGALGAQAVIALVRGHALLLLLLAVVVLQVLVVTHGPVCLLRVLGRLLHVVALLLEHGVSVHFSERVWYLHIFRREFEKKTTKSQLFLSKKSTLQNCPFHTFALPACISRNSGHWNNPFFLLHNLLPSFSSKRTVSQKKTTLINVTIKKFNFLPSHGVKRQKNLARLGRIHCDSASFFLLSECFFCFLFAEEIFTGSALWSNWPTNVETGQGLFYLRRHNRRFPTTQRISCWPT